MSLQKRSRAPQKVEGQVEDYREAESAVLSWGLEYGGQVGATGGYEEDRGQPRTMAKADDIQVEIKGNPDRTANYSVELPENLNGNSEAVEDLLDSLDAEEDTPI